MKTSAVKTSIYLPEDLAGRLRDLVTERGWAWKPSKVVQTLLSEILADPVEQNASSAKLMPSEEKLIERVFGLLEGKTVLLLSQAGQERRRVIDAIKVEAKSRDRGTRVLHISPPCSPEATPEQYFASLGRQSGFEDTTDLAKWEDQLDSRLARGEKIFLVASSFENGDDESRRQVARVLRSLSERYGLRFKLLLCGGERLAALKYEAGELSMLNDAEQVDWPELTVPDLLKWQEDEFPNAGLDVDTAVQFLDLCGGHARLVRHCLQVRQDSAQSRSGGSPGRQSPKTDWQLEDDRQEIEVSSVVWQLFTPYRRRKDRERLQQLLDQEGPLATFQPWPVEALLRKLYWSNLLVEREKGLCWRCEVLRRVGQRALECEDNDS